MKGFERAFPSLDGFQFEAAQDREIAIWLFGWLSMAKVAALENVPFKPPMVLVSGPTGSGKSTLINKLAAATGIAPASLGKFTTSSLFGATNLASPLIWFDNVRIPGRLRARNDLNLYLDCVQYQARSLSREEPVVVLNKVVVFTGFAFRNLSPDLERRSVRIRLLPRN